MMANDKTSLLQEAERRLRRLSLERLRVASDFLAYLEEREEEEATFRRAVRQMEAGEVVRFEDIRTREAQNFYEKADPPLVRRLHRCFEQLRETPYEHPNIRRLKGPLAGFFRYRVGNWRVIYNVDDDAREVTILLIVHRGQAYR
ncbi:MAG: type II toxin-antitoxin system RelE/ParE family toxin [Ardenticatenia bacterium]|nr:type II toxin-antitoxin system RelE/ParE family toxin [Ardenticatenia bacterium]